MQKALHEMLKSALLFYKKLKKDIESAGFVINPYNSCAANRMVNGSQIIITWHVHILKISHKSGWEITKVKKGTKHDCLGMDLVYGVRRELRVSMILKVEKMIEDFPEEIEFLNTSKPTADLLFQVRNSEENKIIPKGTNIILLHSCFL